MSAYNAEAFLREAVDSILAQTLEDFELIVIDDCSTDRTLEILAEYSDPRIRVIRSQCNMGAGTARNRGLRVAQGKYIAVQDADDTSVPDRLAQQVDYLESHPDVGLMGSAQFHVRTPQTLADTFPHIRDFRYPDAALNPDTTSRVEFDTNWFAVPSFGPLMFLCVSPLSDLAITWTLLLHCALANPTVMFRGSVYERLGGFSEKQEHRYCEDYVMFSRFARYTRVANVETLLVTHHDHSASTSVRNEAEQLRQIDTVQQENLSWIMDWKEVSSTAWSVWRKFVFPTSATLPLTSKEVRQLCSMLPVLTSNFYAAYDLGEGEEVARHRRRILYLWARHAVGLSYKPGKAVGMGSRLSLAWLGLRLLGNIFFPAKATRSREQRSLESWVQSDTASY
jgi:glycosyltransferase involved in cell wall biosynthesis